MAQPFPWALLLLSFLPQGTAHSKDFAGFATRPETAISISRAVYTELLGESYLSVMEKLTAEKFLGRWVITPQPKKLENTFVEVYQMAN